MKKLLFLIGVLIYCFSITSQNYVEQNNISYVSHSEKDSYRKERCKLDLYYPKDKKNFPVVVWFHGGGLEFGEKSIPEELKNKGIGIIAVNYRLSPHAKAPAYIEDAAEAVAWTFKNISVYGGNQKAVYVSGHSAGGYLALMIGLDKSYLSKYGIDADQIKGLIPISGQTNTHYTIRKERGLPNGIPLIDHFAPLNCVRKDVPPLLLITGDRNLEMTARYEENAHLHAVLASFGNKVQLFELQGFDHGTVLNPSYQLILRMIDKDIMK